MEQRVGFAPTLMILQTIALLLGYRRIFNFLKLSIYIISKFLRIFNFVFRKRGWRISKRPASYKRHPCPYECWGNIYTAVPYTDWRRRWDSNPRCCYTSIVFKTILVSRLSTSAYKRWKYKTRTYNSGLTNQRVTFTLTTTYLLRSSESRTNSTPYL